MNLTIEGIDQSYEIQPLFDWHELSLCADFVRWTRREVVTFHKFKLKNENSIYDCQVKIVDEGKNDSIEMIVEILRPLDIMLFLEISEKTTFIYENVVKSQNKT